MTGPTGIGDWDAFVARSPQACYLQTGAWAMVKAPNGWVAERVQAGVDDGRIGAQVLRRRPRVVPWSFAYAPRGPIAERWDDETLGAWTEAVRGALGPRRASHLRIDPEIEADGPLDQDGSLRALLGARGWRRAPEIQPTTTRIVDLRSDEAVLWSDLRSKWRQYVNKARSGGITVVDAGETDRLADFHRIMTETSRRAGTAIRTEQAYRDVWAAFRTTGDARLLFAQGPDGDAHAAILLVRCGNRVVEPYGGMTASGAVSRANYLVKWEAIRSSREQGATSYDMWGLVHPGIARFKEGFGGREVRLIGAWDLPLDRIGAAAYRLGEALAGRAGRRRGLRADGGDAGG